MGAEATPYPKVAPDAAEIGAGDEVVVLDGEGGIADEGVLRDVEDGMASVQTGRGWIGAPFGLLAHPDSPQAEACSLFGASS
jgi:hypothetical protein